ncbi:thiamine pyrophosphokinase [Halobacteroides halobius DSM 5150]|uniref:Thiamine diphosphokinase n=1 Tax=Halobacteroides halobius (strain ATCC 35273 / DSM 5150 / MD-1) TaxID=748449 RepID=L0KAY1_HALHC|nr:thiamine diphosphokinase [Halobacteroides halobius]AGB41243.1 thiamine pyrophosphokinase [Halobacteroides halobius DSM 5150]
MKRAIIFINGTLSKDKQFYQDYIKPKDLIACADGGAKHAYLLKITPDLIIGDLDSLSSEIIKHYQNQGVNFEKFPVEKDKTDTELLLDKLITKDYDELIIFAGLGDRFDHTLANIYLLEKYTDFKTRVRFVTPQERIELITNKIKLNNKKNKTISLVPLTDKVTGVTLSGFKYVLNNATLKRGSTLGISNIIQSNQAQIKVKTGKLLIIINNYLKT